jgi:hypothetical protein
MVKEDEGVLCVLCFEKLFFWKSALKHPEIAIHEHSAWLEGPTRCLIKKLSDINSIKQNNNVFIFLWKTFLFLKIVPFSFFLF